MRDPDQTQLTPIAQVFYLLRHRERYLRHSTYATLSRQTLLESVGCE